MSAAYVVACIALAVACFAAVTAWQAFTAGVRTDRELARRRAEADREPGLTWKDYRP